MKNRIFSFTWIIAIIPLASMVMGLLFSNVVQAQSFSPYSDFQAMTLQQLETLQIKLTYVGVSNAPPQSLAFTPSSNTLDLSLFVPFRRPNINYNNDDFIEVVTFSADPSELQTVINNVGTLPNVVAGGVAASEVLSFAMFNSQPGDKAFEAILDQNDATDLFDKLRLSLANNQDGSRKLSEMACPLGLIDAVRPTDVSADAAVVLKGVRLNRDSGRFVTTATITNNSGVAFAEPVSIAFYSLGNVRLFNAIGTTCGTSPVGAPFLNLPGSLGPGASTEIKLDFSNPDLENIELTTKVFTGPGAR